MFRNPVQAPRCDTNARTLRACAAQTLALVLLTLAAHAQVNIQTNIPTNAPATAPTSTQTTYRVAGTVLSGLTGQRVQRASIRLTSTANNLPPLTAVADEFGRFSLSGVPAGSFQLSGEAPGFLPTNLQQHGLFSTAVITGAAVDTESLTLSLRPLGSLSGTVTDESGEPVPNAQVHLFHRDHTLGEARILPGRTTATDDLGRYDFPRLQPNTYFVAVIAQPWYAVHPGPNPFPQQAFGITGPLDPALDVAYPVTFFPGAADSTHAQPIRIDGNAARADLQLTPLPAVTLEIPRNPAEDQTPHPPPQLRVSLFGQPEYIPSQAQQTPAATRITAIAPGDYLVQTPGINGHPGPASPIHLAVDAPATLPPAPAQTPVHLTVRPAPGVTLPVNLYASLIQPGSRSPQPGTPVSPQGEADLAPTPGTYYLQLTDSSGKLFFLRDIRADNKPLPDSTLQLTATSKVALTATVVASTHTLQGTVQKNGKPCPGAMLLLVPAESHPDLRLFFRQQSDLDGSFQIPALPAGPYLLVALENGWNLDWRDPAFLARILPHSVPVLIPESPAPANIQLPHPIAIQQP